MLNNAQQWTPKELQKDCYAQNVQCILQTASVFPSSLSSLPQIKELEVPHIPLAGRLKNY